MTRPRPCRLRPSPDARAASLALPSGAAPPLPLRLGRHRALPDGRVQLLYRGVTNAPHPLPVDADALFWVGSITKTYTLGEAPAAALRPVPSWAV